MLPSDLWKAKVDLSNRRKTEWLLFAGTQHSRPFTGVRLRIVGRVADSISHLGSQIEKNLGLVEELQRTLRTRDSNSTPNAPTAAIYAAHAYA